MGTSLPSLKMGQHLAQFFSLFKSRRLRQKSSLILHPGKPSPAREPIVLSSLQELPFSAKTFNHDHILCLRLFSFRLQFEVSEHRCSEEKENRTQPRLSIHLPHPGDNSIESIHCVPIVRKLAAHRRYDAVLKDVHRVLPCVLCIECFHREQSRLNGSPSLTSTDSLYSRHRMCLHSKFTSLANMTSRREQSCSDRKSVV